MATIVYSCPHCPAEHVPFKVVWTAAIPGDTEAFNGVAICTACGGPICFQTRAGNYADPRNQQNDISAVYDVSGPWPGISAPVAPRHTPPSVVRRFLEGEDAYRRRNWNSAVAMYRSSLDIATKGLDGVPAGLTFFKRLEWMNSNHKITPDMWTWATHVRVEGNASLHDPDDFVEADAKSLRLFTETFLRYVFELPGEVSAFRRETETAE